MTVPLYKADFVKVVYHIPSILNLLSKVHFDLVITVLLKENMELSQPPEGATYWSNIALCSIVGYY